MFFETVDWVILPVSRIRRIEGFSAGSRPLPEAVSTVIMEDNTEHSVNDFELARMLQRLTNMNAAAPAQFLVTYDRAQDRVDRAPIVAYGTTCLGNFVPVTLAGPEGGKLPRDFHAIQFGEGMVYTSEGASYPTLELWIASGDAG